MTKVNDGWISTKEWLPAAGAVVYAMDSGGNVQRLKRNGALWFLEDGSMYVYYTPIAWKSLNWEEGDNEHEQH